MRPQILAENFQPLYVRPIARRGHHVLRDVELFIARFVTQRQPHFSILDLGGLNGGIQPDGNLASRSAPSPSTERPAPDGYARCGTASAGATCGIGTRVHPHKFSNAAKAPSPEVGCRKRCQSRTLFPRMQAAKINDRRTCQDRDVLPRLPPVQPARSQAEGTPADDRHRLAAQAGDVAELLSYGRAIRVAILH